MDKDNESMQRDQRIAATHGSYDARVDYKAGHVAQGRDEIRQKVSCYSERVLPWYVESYKATGNILRAFEYPEAFDHLSGDQIRRGVLAHLQTSLFDTTHIGATLEAAIRWLDLGRSIGDQEDRKVDEEARLQVQIQAYAQRTELRELTLQLGKNREEANKLTTRINEMLQGA